jgi:acyl dehydratase
MAGFGGLGSAMADFDAEEFPLVARGHRFEDFTVGQVFVHHWGRTLTAGDNALFCTATCHWVPMYLNAEFARAHGHPDVVLNPMLVLCTVVGLSVEDLSEAGGPFLGVEDCTFHRPLYPGDTVTARSTVVQTRPSARRPDAGVVSWFTEAHDQRGELVLDFLRTNLLARRTP